MLTNVEQFRLALETMRCIYTYHDTTVVKGLKPPKGAPMPRVAIFISQAAFYFGENGEFLGTVSDELCDFQPCMPPAIVEEKPRKDNIRPLGLPAWKTGCLDDFG